MDRETSQAVSSHNMGYMNSSALQMRLETADKIEAIERFLSGHQYISIQNKETGKVTYQKAKVGKRLMNDEGVAHLTNYVAAIINPQVVQGNYGLDWYRQMIELTHKRIAEMIVANRPKWEIDPHAKSSIVGFIMEYVKPFLSRLIENKERESYAATIRSVESSTMQQSGGFMSNAIGMK